ncbi:hypothetical protein SCP_0502520 [Sparassis crispa]|uniref:Uncharacterized protein n=1 Tax=Sparassis crispa TaxID=139825 RepID=A0A401GLY8_9APHY|nr:hypothetical protein SCP_0502520 [Sparassis crispa]GBE83205.1 hypothetical protein SCP_0502520 [Sparassis crispa]
MHAKALKKEELQQALVHYAEEMHAYTLQLVAEVRKQRGKESGTDAGAEEQSLDLSKLQISSPKSPAK